MTFSPVKVQKYRNAVYGTFIVEAIRLEYWNRDTPQTICEISVCFYRFVSSLKALTNFTMSNSVIERIESIRSRIQIFFLSFVGEEKENIK